MGSKNYISNVTIFEKKSLINNSDGLYLLNQSITKKGELQSFELLGRVPSQSEKKVGVLLLVLEGKKGMLRVKNILQAGNNTIFPEQIIKINKTSFKESRRVLNRGDYIALYLPKIGDSALQINTNESGIKFAFLKGSRNINNSWSNLQKLKPEVTKLIDKEQKWKNIEGHLNFRVRIKLGNNKRKPQGRATTLAENDDRDANHTVKIIVIGTTITVFFLALLVIIITFLVLKISKRKPRGAEGMLLENFGGNDERTPNQHSTVSIVVTCVATYIIGERSEPIKWCGRGQD